MDTVLSHALRACSTAGATTTQAAGGGGTGLQQLGSFDWIGLFASLAVPAVFGIGIALAVLIANRISDRPVRVPIPIDARVSPDGYYWWDGAAWRPRFY